MHLVLIKIYIIGIILILYKAEINARILTEREAAMELRNNGISMSFISNWVCLMKAESNLNTGYITGPGYLSSFSYGIFQINSLRWCGLQRKGGDCNANCYDFIDDDITDDIRCAKKIYNSGGFQYWNGWIKYCRNKQLPAIQLSQNHRFSPKNKII